MHSHRWVPLAIAVRRWRCPWRLYDLDECIACHTKRWTRRDG